MLITKFLFCGILENSVSYCSKVHIFLYFNLVVLLFEFQVQLFIQRK